ncbi:MAG: hypothetical protein V3W31_00615 [Thermodesulfobacteriota bacterium]
MSEGHGHEEELKDVTVALEADQIEALGELAREYSEKLGQQWDLSAVVRVAVGDLLTKLGRMA